MHFKISQLGLMDFVNLNDGVKLGPIKDINIDPVTGKVVSLVLSRNKKYFGLLRAGGSVVVPWEKIKKIGVHTVLLEIDTHSY